MPRKSTTAAHNELLQLSQAILGAADVLDDESGFDYNPDDDDLVDSADEQERQEQREVADILRFLAAEWVTLVGNSWGDGTRGKYGKFKKPSDFFDACLLLPDAEFRSVFRMSSPSFWKLARTLSENQIFVSKGKRPQRPVHVQLGTYLIRYGQLGSPVVDTALKMGIGRGTVELYTRRVIRAIRELRDRFGGQWMTEEELEYVEGAIVETTGFEGCAGSGDGMLVPSTQAPRINGKAFLGRKGFFGYAVQATVNHDIYFTSWELSWPASVTDTRIFKSSDFWQKRHTYLRNGRYILVDKGYPSSPHTVRPFSEPEILRAAASGEQQRMRDFNKHLSSQRITVEHAFGALKGRFQSLRAFGPHRNKKDVWRAIESMLILHNMLLWLGDHPSSTPGAFGIPEDINGHFDNDVDPDLPPEHPAQGEDINIPPHETDTWLKQEGDKKRMEIMNKLFPAEEYQ